MTLPVGTISMSQVNTELGYGSTANISLNQAAVRTLAQVPSGTISMNNLRGKSNSYTTNSLTYIYILFPIRFSMLHAIDDVQILTTCPELG